MLTDQENSCVRSTSFKFFTSTRNGQFAVELMKFSAICAVVSNFGLIFSVKDKTIVCENKES